MIPEPNLKSTHGKLLLMLMGIGIIPLALTSFILTSIGRIQGSWRCDFFTLIYLLMVGVDELSTFVAPPWSRPSTVLSCCEPR